MTAPAFAFERLADRTVLAIEGAEAEAFLHGLVTAEVRGLAPGEARYAALLTPQGKVLFDFFLLRVADGYLLDCAADQREELAKRLGFYKLRAKVTIVKRDDLGVAAAAERPRVSAVFADPRTPLAGWRVIGPVAELPPGIGRDYRQARIKLGLADSGEIGSGVHFPHEVNFDQLHAVDFGKGCYVGQEVVSRMEHRSTARSRICPIDLSGTPAAGGTDIRADGKGIGTVLTLEGLAGLALVRLDRLAEAHGSSAQLLTGTATVHVRKPPWANFDVAGA